jgi:PAS domain S-box-containing protein
VWDWDLISGELYLDESLVEGIGYAADAVGGSHDEWMQFVHEDDAASVRDAYEAHLAGRTPQLVAEYRRVHKDGTSRWIFTRGSILLDDAGVPVRLIGTDIDITDRKLVEQALVRTEQNYRSIFENSLEGIVQTTLEGRFIRMNPAMAKILGYDTPRQAVLGITNLEKQLYVDPQRRKELLRDLKKHGEVKDFVARMKKQDGSLFWSSANCRAIRDSSGSIYYIESFVQDISDKLDAEEALRASEKKYRTVIENIPVIVWSVNTEGRFTLFEGRGIDALMLDDSLVGKHVEDVFSDVPPLTEMMAESLAGEALQRTVSWNGFVLNTISRPMLDAKKIITGVIAVAVDISEQAVNEEMIRRTEKMEALGTLAGGIAHDFNNILTAVVNLTTLADMQVDKESKVHKDLVQVLVSAERGRDIVRQILTFCKRGREEKRPVQPAALIQEDIKLLRATMPENIAIDLDLRDRDGFIHIDPAQLHQLLLNLCSNAADAMGSKGGTLSIRLGSYTLEEEKKGGHPDLSPGKYMLISVGDTGTGIDPSIKEKIFTPFFSTKPKGKGTGMGLAVVHGIVKKNEGDVTIEQRKEGGTWFHVSLPKHQVEGRILRRKKSRLPSGGSVLFVDDEEIVAYSGGEILRNYGFDVVTSTSAEDAMDIIKKDPSQFDILITDMIMPNINGMELAESVKGVRPDIPVVMFSGYTEPDEEQAWNTINAFLYKPIDWELLADKVDSILQNKKAGILRAHG